MIATLHLKSVWLFLLIVAYNDVDFVFTAFSLSFVIALHWLWPIWRALLAEQEAFADISSFEMVFSNFSGGSENGFLKCLNTSINLILLKQNSFSNDFVSSWLFEGQAFVDSYHFGYTWFRQCSFWQCIFIVLDANSPTVNLDCSIVLFIGLINPHGTKNTNGFLNNKVPLVECLFYGGQVNASCCSKTLIPILVSVCSPKLLTKEASPWNILWWDQTLIHVSCKRIWATAFQAL